LRRIGRADAVWARFDMTGYKLGDGNKLDIEYGLAVLRADGTQAYAEPQAATRSSSRFIRCVISPACSVSIWQKISHAAVHHRFEGPRQFRRSDF